MHCGTVEDAPWEDEFFDAAGRGWGEIAFSGADATLSVLGGELDVDRDHRA